MIERCYFHCRLGFPSTIWQLCEIATSVVQKRSPDEKLGQRWEKAFKKKHLEVKTRFSKLIDFIRNIRGNDIDLMNHFFNKILYIIPIFYFIVYFIYLFIYLLYCLFIYPSSLFVYLIN